VILTAAMAAPLGVVSAWAGSGETGVAATVSGLPFSPRVERSVRVGARGTAIRFEGPASGRLATVHTLWRRPSRGCRIALRPEGNGLLGDVLATASVPDGATGWVGLPLDADLAGGTVYHLLVTCDSSSKSRLAYVRDGDRRAGRCGGWAVERFRRGRLRARPCGVAPVFALTFSDGTWWGQPYRPLRRPRSVRVCGRKVVAALVVPTRPVLL
jgi:hypothetical protein